MGRTGRTASGACYVRVRSRSRIRRRSRSRTRCGGSGVTRHANVTPAVLLRRVNRKFFWNGGGNHEHVRTIALQVGFQDVICRPKVPIDRQFECNCHSLQLEIMCQLDAIDKTNE